MTMVLFIAMLMALFLLGVPVAFSLVITAVTLMGLIWGTVRVSTIPQMMISGINSFTMLAVPLFLLAGKLMNTGGITARLFNFAKAVIGFLPGGLGHVNVVASVIFAGMSGTAVSDAGGLGAIEIKAMKDNGFDSDFACAVTASSSTIGPIIPPSLPMVIYGMVASASVGALFLAGILPGLFMSVVMMGVVAFYAKRKGYPREPAPTLPMLVRSIRESFLPLLTPVIIIGGIYTGMFTPTEAAVVAVVYAFILSVCVYREMTLTGLVQTLRETVADSAAIGLILAASTLYGNILIRAQIPQKLLTVMTGSIDSPVVMLLAINVFLLIVGCFMEPISAIMILMPLFNPILKTMDIDPIHFGVVMILNLMIGLLTPPVGMVLFVISRIGGIPILRLARAMGPWLAALLFVLLVLTLFPEISLFLPRALGRM